MKTLHSDLLTSIYAVQSSKEKIRLKKSLVSKALQSGGVDGTRTRGLRRDRPAF